MREARNRIVAGQHVVADELVHPIGVGGELVFLASLPGHAQRDVLDVLSRSTPWLPSGLKVSATALLALIFLAAVKNHSLSRMSLPPAPPSRS